MLLIPAALTRPRFPLPAAGGILAPQLKLVNELSRRLNASQGLSLPSLENNPSLSLHVNLLLPLFSSTSPDRWQSPVPMCPRLYRSGCKHAEMFLKVLLCFRLTRAPRSLRRTDTAIPFSGVSLYGMCIGLLSCVYFLLKS